ALLTVLVALAATMARRAPLRYEAGFGRSIGRCIALAGIAIAALSAAIATELVLTGIRFAEAELDAAALVPALLLVAEIAAAAGVTAYLVGTARRLSLALRLAGG